MQHVDFEALIGHPVVIVGRIGSTVEMEVWVGGKQMELINME